MEFCYGSPSQLTQLLKTAGLNDLRQFLADVLNEAYLENHMLKIMTKAITITFKVLS